MAANGGETRTHGLYDGSPALGFVEHPSNGMDDYCIDADFADGVDQRGQPRPSLPTPCAAGAFEGSVGPPPPPPPVRCAGKVATKVGTAGPDLLIGTGKPDVIAALAGNDVVRGLAGNDLLCGGAGGDRLFGGKGRDRLLGQAGPDLLRGGPGLDKLRGGPGGDRQRQ